MSWRDRLDALVIGGAIAPIDARFAEAMLRLDSGADAELVSLGAALASRAVQRGHVCADLAALARGGLLDGDGIPVEGAALDLDGCLGALRASRLTSDDGSSPLVLRGSRLYLQRYFAYEARLARAIAGRAAGDVAVDEPLLRDGLGRYFDDDAAEQRNAAEVAIRRRLSVITGGPGTGKTTTVAKILALAGEQALGRGQRPAMLLVAPTGKAAQRLGESIRSSAARIARPAAVEIPGEATTIHRALGVLARAPTRFRHDAESPLNADLVLADEASMIDLALMTKLVEAVPEHARLILLGDKDQLASVEAGAVLSDMCDAPRLGPCVARLQKSYRFAAGSGIASLARAVVEGDAAQALAVLGRDTGMPYGEVALHDAAPELVASRLAHVVVNGFSTYLQSEDPARRLRDLEGFRVLCVHRRGPTGVAALNETVERLLRAHGKLEGEGVFYDGRPILVTRNDPQLGLSNGDIGVVSGDRRVYFAAEEGRARAVPLGRLPEHETVFAMTVHKAQGSEMDRVALVLPAEPSPILTRELLYTAITRGRQHVDIFGSASVLAAGIARRIDRASGLRDAL